MMSGGTIPAHNYKSSTYVGLRHLVIDWHDLSTLSPYEDLAHTGAAYYAIE